MLKDEFLGLIFGDKRLNNRCENILDLLTENPRMSFPDAAGNWSQLKGLYRFFANTNVTKGLKTGCLIEKRQLGTIGQHLKLLSMFSVFAWSGLVLRFNAACGCQDGLIELTKTQIEILKNKYPKYSEKIDAASTLKYVAMPGGFIGRKSDGSPGWKTLLIGLTKLDLMEQGFLMAKAHMGNGQPLVRRSFRFLPISEIL